MVVAEQGKDVGCRLLEELVLGSGDAYTLTVKPSCVDALKVVDLSGRDRLLGTRPMQ